MNIYVCVFIYNTYTHINSLYLWTFISPIDHHIYAKLPQIITLFEFGVQTPSLVFSYYFSFYRYKFSIVKSLRMTNATLGLQD